MKHRFKYLCKNWFVAIAVQIVVLATMILGGACDKSSNKDRWWTYLAAYDNNRPGSILVNLSLKDQAPITNFQFLVVTGVSYTPSNSNGLPNIIDLDALNSLGDKRLKTIRQSTSAILAGTFTYNGERLDYIYITNREGIEKTLTNFYQVNCPMQKFYINVKNDGQWDAYRSFLLPNEQTIQFYRQELIKIGYLTN